jgi:hypothetical protein
MVFSLSFRIVTIIEMLDEFFEANRGYGKQRNQLGVIDGM